MDPRYPIGKFAFDPHPTAEKRRISIAAIGRFPAELKTVLPSARLDRPYREGGWTGRQVVHHLADSHMNAFVRIRLALTEESPTIKPYEQSAWAELADSRTADAEASVQILDGLHRRWHMLLQSLAEADFTRGAVHPDVGRVTIDWFLQLYAWHGRHHIGHLELTGL